MEIMLKRLFLILLITFANCAFAAETETCDIVSVKGKVEVFSVEKAAWVKAEKGMILKKGDSVRTARASFCGLNIKGHTLKLKENTKIELKELAFNKIALELQKGELLSKLAKLSPDASFSVKSPVAVAGVRGTSFGCGYNDASGVEEVAVFEEAVKVTASGEDEKYITVPAMQETTVSKWGDTILSAKGTGLLADVKAKEGIPETGEKISEAEFMKRFGADALVVAQRAAQVDGYRRLAEKIYGIVIDYRSTLGDMAEENPEVASTVQGIVRGAEIVNTEYFSDGSIVLTMESGGNQITGGLKAVTGDIFGVHYLSVPVPIEIKDFDAYLELMP